MTALKRYRLTVRLLEDLHTGTGTGGGDIDALQMRDRRGRPVIRANHLKGLLLAAGEELARFDERIKAPLQDLLGAGGKPRGGLRLTSLRLTKDSPGHTLIWTSTAREKGSRRPLEDTLRVVEHVAAGSSFTAELRVPQALESLLKTLVERIDRLGSDRNRGGGLISTRLDEITDEIPASRQQPIVGNCLRLRLRNLEPLCLPATGHPGNLIQSLPFVRGQVLRGALMAWALARDDQGALANLARASVGDALPLPPCLNDSSPESLCVLPIPLSILTPKPGNGNADLPWWVEAGKQTEDAYDDLDLERIKPEEKSKRPGAREFLAREGGQGAWLRYSPRMSVHMRNQTADLFDLSGRPVTEPELFSMEEIAEETRFVADLVFPDERAAQGFAERFAPLLSGAEWLAVGREGRPVEVAELASVALLSPGASTLNDTWTLTLVSDLVSRGEHLGFLTNLDVPSLIRLAGKKADHYPGWKEWKMRGFAESERLHGFNAASGLRRTPALAIRRGSCWRITGTGSGALALALSTMNEFGERTQEGCGRFAIDLQPMKPLARPDGQKDKVPANSGEKILLAVERIAEDKHATDPSLSQLQWLRSSTLAATSEAQLHELLEKIKAIAGRRPKGGGAWKDFPHNALRREIDRLGKLDEKRRLISHLVQRLALQALKRAEEQRT
ncbi:MAG: CRISPR-associated RAMP protein, Csx10 family [Candidatus Accumulibacter phosphatis]|uniref:CRISPR-associated RAMP protein, Csx10 family n=1 Tax=Candidatus Accumulibacter phosphatis TaxID=327160 RepID=A0A080M391_9PROT|nr:RAMP superfamily CRISPR-associated protein [Accumulibacter sp.]KFB71599.1 MAG: CRISPR-associated RAMP protein, Csx10 family [Candidatus Accumulibacter phosphatis]HRF06891.1 hypothetical protein [Accumulibacter sp.]